MKTFNSVLDIIDFADEDNELSVDDVRYEDANEFREFIADKNNNFENITVFATFRDSENVQHTTYVRVNRDTHGDCEYILVSPNETDFKILRELYKLI